MWEKQTSSGEKQINSDQLNNQRDSYSEPIPTQLPKPKVPQRNTTLKTTSSRQPLGTYCSK